MSEQRGWIDRLIADKKATAMSKSSSSPAVASATSVEPSPTEPAGNIGE